MSEEFDPYRIWLGIPPKDQPPHHYRLLAIEPFESDPDVIQHAADQRMAHLRSLQAGKHPALTQKLLNEIAAARVCLLSAEKAAYDNALRAKLKTKTTAVAPRRKRSSRRKTLGPLVISVVGGALMALAAAGYFWGSDLWKAAPDGAAPGGAARPPAAIVIAPAPDASMPQFVDLADIIGGGNGFGSGRKGVGIDPSTGMLSRDVGQEMQGPVNRFQRTASPLVDGVFIPNGNVKGSRIPVQVSSSGIQVADLPSTSGHWQGFPRNGADADSQSVLNFIDYQSAGHSVLGLHANLGITFDLSAIRKLLPERKLAMFTAWLGNSSIGSTEFRVYLDGKCQAICSEITNSSRATRVQVPLASARFLTLISLDAGTFGHDATFLGDPRLMLDRVSAADKKK